MIEVSTGKISYSENVDCDCPIEKVLTSSVVAIARKISENMRAQTAAAPSNVKLLNGEQAQPSQKWPAMTRLPRVQRNPLRRRHPQSPKEPRSHNHAWRRDTCCGGAGFALDNMLKARVNDNAKLQADYKAQPGNSQYMDYAIQISNNNKSANTYQNLRNASYILSGWVWRDLRYRFSFNVSFSTYI